MKKVKIIYRSGAETTVTYDETKVKVFSQFVKKNRDFSKPIALTYDEDGLDLFIRGDQVDHMEVLDK